MSTTELLPCPFCGGTPTIEANFGHSWWVQCTSCGASHGVIDVTPQEAEARWNRRASQPQQPAPAEPVTKQQLIDFLASRRQELGGSISEHNHRRLLATNSKADLLAQYKRIVENERAAAAAVQPPAEPIVVIEIKTFEGGTRRMDWSGDDFHWGRLPDGKHPLYAAAAAVQPPVLPLTEEEIDSAWEASGDAWLEQPYAQPSRENLFARAIEAKVRGTGSVPPSAP